VRFTDRLHGPTSGVVDDVVLRRRDGVPAYNLAVVVDDAAQGIDEVVRGDDLLTSTARQLHLGRLLGLADPSYAHVPLVLGPDGRRLAKRHGAVTLADLRAEGWSPPDVLVRLAVSLRLAAPGERPPPEQLVERFDPALLPVEPWVFPESP
jgi:glutamyl-tRNA synthetase